MKIGYTHCDQKMVSIQAYFVLVGLTCPHHHVHLHSIILVITSWMHSFHILNVYGWYHGYLWNYPAGKPRAGAKGHTIDINVHFSSHKMIHVSKNGSMSLVCLYILSVEIRGGGGGGHWHIYPVQVGLCAAVNTPILWPDTHPRPLFFELAPHLKPLFFELGPHRRPLFLGCAVFTLNMAIAKITSYIQKRQTSIKKWFHIAQTWSVIMLTYCITRPA